MPADNLDNADWNSLRDFVVLVERQTLTAAAEALGVQHSTVSRHIAQLESALGLHLFDRIGKRYLLTAEGRQLYDKAQDIAKNIRLLQRSAREQREAVSEVVLSAPPAVIHSLLPPYLREFHARHPRIRLILDSNSGFSDLHRREADIALRMSRPQAPDLAVRPLRSVHFGFYARARYLAQTDRADWCFFSLTVRNRFTRWADAHLENERVILAANDFSVIKQLICDGLGIGFLPDYAVRPEDGLLPAALNGDHPETLEETLYLVMHEDVRRTRAVRAAADFWTETLSQTARES